MYLGHIVEHAPTEIIMESQRHPYSRALLSAVLFPDPHRRPDPYVIRGGDPDGDQSEAGVPALRAAARSAKTPAAMRCRRWLRVEAIHYSACRRWDDVAASMADARGAA